jgi:hypothetical protein
MERIGDNVRRTFDRFAPAGSIGRVVEVWPDAVGASIAANAWPARVARDGTLHVTTSSSAWAFELSQLAPTIVERLQAEAGEAAPKRLRFAPGFLPEPAAAEFAPATPRPAPPSPEAVAQGKELAAAITDEELRALVARAAAASLSRAADDRPF